ncbi:MAG: glycosyltransferase family 39 protein [Perlucidibaca sp.]
MNLGNRLSRMTLAQGLLLALAIKLALAWLLPMTGDEAYFVLWGRHLDYGYYDHPPMAGWMTWLQLQLSDHRVWLRMPGILTELLIACWLHALLRRHDADKARWLALLFTFSPLSLLFVFTLTDTGCMLFAGLSFACAWQSVQARAEGRGQGLGWAAAAGAGLGLAFLSKYFAVFLGLAYLIYCFGVQRSAWRMGVVLVLTAIPFGLLNLQWNYSHCWSNLLFNLVNRTRGEDGFSPGDLFSYLGMMLYVVLPPVLMALWRVRGAAAAPVAEGLRLARVIVLTALLGFLFVSLRKTIGLHWVLWFYPMVLVLLWPLAPAQWPRLLGLVGWISLVHVVIITSLLALPNSAWQFNPKVQRQLLSAREAPAILALARAQVGDLPLAAQGYTPASVLSYQVNEPVMVMGTGSKYARQDDFWTDFRALDGRSVLVFLKRPDEAANVAAWFRSSRPLTVRYQGQAYDFVVGEGFDYARYHDQVLVPVRDSYYQFPDWLPQGQCGFIARYFQP